MTKPTPPLKWHGGKSYLADDIIALMPPRCAKPNAPADDDPGFLHFVEPYAGGLAVLLAIDPNGISEVVNDINRWLTTFWRVLQDEGLFTKFNRCMQATPFSQAEYEWCDAFKSDCVEACKSDPVKAAHWFFVCCRQSLAGRMTNFAPLSRNRTRKGMNEQASAWLGAVDGLQAVHERLRRVVILNQDALDVIRGQDGPRTLYYLDPPYCHGTRATTGEYAHEMTDEEHAKLLDVLQGIKGRFLLSGYRSGMYDRAAAENGWRRHDFVIDNKAAGGKSKRKMTECVWCNF